MTRMRRPSPLGEPRQIRIDPAIDGRPTNGSSGDTASGDVPAESGRQRG